MLADRSQNCNHRLLSHTIFDDESRISLYFLVVVPANSICFFDTLAFQQHYQKHGHSHHSCTGLLWTHETNSTRYRCWWFQSRCLCANMLRWRWSGVSLGHRSGCLERCSAVTKHLWTVWIKTQRRVHLISTTLVLDAEIKLIMLLIWRMARFFCPSSIHAHVAPGWECFSDKHGVWLLYDTLWHSSISWHLPLRKTKTWEPNNIFNNYRLGIA